MGNICRKEGRFPNNDTSTRKNLRADEITGFRLRRKQPIMAKLSPTCSGYKNGYTWDNITTYNGYQVKLFYVSPRSDSSQSDLDDTSSENGYLRNLGIAPNFLHISTSFESDVSSTENLSPIPSQSSEKENQLNLSPLLPIKYEEEEETSEDVKHPLATPVGLECKNARRNISKRNESPNEERLFKALDFDEFEFTPTQDYIRKNKNFDSVPFESPNSSFDIFDQILSMNANYNNEMATPETPQKSLKPLFGTLDEDSENTRKDKSNDRLYANEHTLFTTNTSNYTKKTLRPNQILSDVPLQASFGSSNHIYNQKPDSLHLLGKFERCITGEALCNANFLFSPSNFRPTTHQKQLLEQKNIYSISPNTRKKKITTRRPKRKHHSTFASNTYQVGENENFQKTPKIEMDFTERNELQKDAAHILDSNKKDEKSKELPQLKGDDSDKDHLSIFPQSSPNRERIFDSSSDNLRPSLPQVSSTYERAKCRFSPQEISAYEKDLFKQKRKKKIRRSLGNIQPKLVRSRINEIHQRMEKLNIQSEFVREKVIKLHIRCEGNHEHERKSLTQDKNSIEEYDQVKIGTILIGLGEEGFNTNQSESMLEQKSAIKSNWVGKLDKNGNNFSTTLSSSSTDPQKKKLSCEEDDTPEKKDKKCSSNEKGENLGGKGESKEDSEVSRQHSIPIVSAIIPSQFSCVHIPHSDMKSILTNSTDHNFKRHSTKDISKCNDVKTPQCSPQVSLLSKIDHTGSISIIEYDISESEVIGDNITYTPMTSKSSSSDSHSQEQEMNRGPSFPSKTTLWLSPRQRTLVEARQWRGSLSPATGSGSSTASKIIKEISFRFRGSSEDISLKKSFSSK